MAHDSWWSNERASFNYYQLSSTTMRHLTRAWENTPTLITDKGLTLETSALKSLYGGQFTFIYQLCW